VGNIAAGLTLDEIRRNLMDPTIPASRLPSLLLPKEQQTRHRLARSEESQARSPVTLQPMFHLI
jgi:hypothetical protein